MKRVTVLAGLMLWLPTIARADMPLPFPYTNTFTRIAAGAFVLALGAGVIWGIRRARRGSKDAPKP